MPAASQAEIEGQHLEEGEAEAQVRGWCGAGRLAAVIFGVAAMVAVAIAIVTSQGGGNSNTPSISSGSHSLGDRVAAGIWAQKDQPLTVLAALKQGWTAMDTDACHSRYGRRYRLGARLSPTLMFDNLGTLAGMQITVDTNTFPLYPESNLKDAFITGDGEAGATLHFIDPDRICNADETLDEGTVGDRLWMRTADGFEIIPIHITDDDAVPSGYSPSGCAPSSFAYPGSPGMGMHYWRGLRTELKNELACEDTGPVFLLYNAQMRLTAIGFTYVGKNYKVPTVGNVLPTRTARGSYENKGDNDELWEFASQPLNPFFFTAEDNPKCLKYLNTFDTKDNEDKQDGTVTTGTLHVFLTDPYTIECPST